MHFDEAVDRVNLDVLTFEEADQLVQLCQEAAEAHRALGEMEQALTVYNALQGFLQSRGWNDKVAQVEFMLQQMQNTAGPARPVTPPPVAASPAPQPPQQPQQVQQMDMTQVIPSEQMARIHQQPRQQAAGQDAATMAFKMGTSTNVPPPASAQLPTSSQVSIPGVTNQVNELPDWLTGILTEADKTQVAGSGPTPASSAQSAIVEQPTTEQPIASVPPASPPANSVTAAETTVMKPVQPVSAWLTEDAKPGNATRIIPPESEQTKAEIAESSAAPTVQEAQPTQAMAPVPSEQATQMIASVQQPDVPDIPAASAILPTIEQVSPVLQHSRSTGRAAEDLLSQIAGSSNKDQVLKQVAEAVLASTASLPENIRLPVVQSMQDIQKYINHGLLTPATEECLRVIDMAPQYLDVHQVLCEIYVRQGKVEQAITKYAILVDTYVVNGRIDDAIATYRRILQLEPNNLTYRMRLINLLSTQGNKEDLLRERTLAAESYLRLGYMDRALTELEQALQESPTSVPTRLNYALALQKLGRTQQAVAEYQRVLQIDPRNITALVRWHIVMITSLGTARATALEVLSRIRWQLRGEGQRNYEVVAREYNQAGEIHPNNADVHFALGQIHQQAGQYDKAIDAYTLAMHDSAVEIMARVSASHCLLSQGKPEAAIEQLEQALQSVRRGVTTSIDPTIWAARPREEGEEHQAPEVEISMLLAKAYGRIGKQEQMQAILRQVKQKTTYQDEVSSTLAEISARQGDIDSALQEYADLVRQYRSKRQVENALSVLNEMIRLAPEDPRAHNELANIYVNRGLLEEGIAELRLLANIYQRGDQAEGAAMALQRIGNIYADMGDTEEALINLRRAVELAPNSMELLREIVGFCMQLGRSQEAAQYQVVIARHYFDTHQVKEAVAALQQLIAIDRTNYEAYDMLGQTYQTVGEYEQASRVYRNLARVNPENAIARERLAALQELRTR
jgi:tetratricopeptide (TPR) repeat protein